LRALRDKLIEKFYLGKSFVSWYYRAGPKGASWLNHHAGWKPLVRAGLIVPVSISKILFTSKFYHKLAVVLLMMGCFAFAYGAGRHEDWTTSRTIFVGSAIAFFAIIVYGIVMKPEFARANRTDTQLDSQRVYFLYEDHIGRPVLMSEYADYEEDGSYFTDDNKNGYPYWQVYYNMPLGATDYWASTGITIGDPNTTGIVWLVPFRFPGQYQDFVDSLDLFYNWNRWYMPGMGRYTQADQLYSDVQFVEVMGVTVPVVLHLTQDNLYAYANDSPFKFIDPTGMVTLPGSDWVSCGRARTSVAANALQQKYHTQNIGMEYSFYDAMYHCVGICLISKECGAGFLAGLAYEASREGVNNTIGGMWSDLANDRYGSKCSSKDKCSKNNTESCTNCCKNSPLNFKNPTPPYDDAKKYWTWQ